MDKLRSCFFLTGFILSSGTFAQHESTENTVAEISQGGYNPDVIFIEFAAHTHMWCLPPLQEQYNYWNPFDKGLPPLVKFTVFDPLWQKDSTGIYFEDVHPNNLSTNDLNEKPKSPDRLLLEEAWYEAVPSILNFRRKT